jgi:hypothetical protein
MAETPRVLVQVMCTRRGNSAIKTEEAGRWATTPPRRRKPRLVSRRASRVGIRRAPAASVFISPAEHRRVSPPETHMRSAGSAAGGVNLLGFGIIDCCRKLDGDAHCSAPPTSVE